MDQKTAAEYLDPSSHVALVVNGDFDKNGAINKRRGMAALPTVATSGNPFATTITSAARLTSWTRSQLALFTNGALYNYSQASGSFTEIAPAPTSRVVRRPFLSPSLFQYLQPVTGDVAYNGRTVRVVLYTTTNYKLYISAFDADSGDVLLQPTNIFTGGSPTNFPVPYGVYFLPNATATQQVALIYSVTNAGTQTLYGVSLNLANRTPSTAVSIASAFGWADAVPYIGDPSGGLVVMTVTGTSPAQVTFRYVSSAFAVVSGPTVVDSFSGYFGSGPITAHATYGGNIWFTWTLENNALNSWSIRAIALAGATGFATTFAAQTVQTVNAAIGCTGIVATSATSAVYTYTIVDNTTGGLQTNDWAGGTLTTPSTVAAFTLPYGMQPIARPFVQNGQVLQPCVWSTASSNNPTSLQTTFYVMGINPALTTYGKALPVATIAPRQGVPTGGSGGFGEAFNGQAGARIPFGSGTSTTTRVAFAFSTIGEDTTIFGSIGPSCWIADVTADTSLLYQCGELVDGLHVSAATPMTCDGQTFVENNFVHYPEFSYATTSGTTGSLSGTYIYAVAYIFVDAAGNLTRSAPWQLPAVSLTGGALATIHIPTLSCTWREIASPGQVFAEVYRTTSNGSTFYLVGTVNAQYTGGVYTSYGPDSASDTSIAIDSLEYTTGGVLDGVNPPAAACQVIHKNRLWIVDDTLRGVWFTKAGSQGDAVAFNEALYFPCTEGGDITALASLDDKLVIFKADAIYLVYGDGPADTGQGSDLTVPQRVACDVGALDWRSVVLMPAGLMFRSAQGIYMLDRQQTVTYVGKNVEDTLAQYPTVVGATLVASAQHVRFLCTDGTASIAIVYDYQSNAWGTYVYAQPVAPPVSCALSFGSDRFAMVTADGNSWIERLLTDTQAFRDDKPGGGSAAFFVPTTITTPWVKLSGLQAYMRARRAMLFGTAQDSHGLTMGFAVNYVPTVVQTNTWTSPFLGYGSQVEEHFAGAYNKAMAVQITVSDTAGAAITTGAGCRFVGLAIELDNLGQKYRKNAVMARG